MRYFWIKISAMILAAAMLFITSFKLVHDTSDNMSDSQTAYNLSSWLAKNDIIIDRDIINTDDKYVYSAVLTNAITDHSTAAAAILGSEAAGSGANKYKGDRGTVVFSDDAFSFTPNDDAFSQTAAKADKYNMGKRSEEIIADMGFDLGGCVISAGESNGELTAQVYKTIDSKPVFNDRLDVVISNKRLRSVSGVWYMESGIPTEKRRAKSAADALCELLQKSGGSGKITIKAMTLGYKMNTENGSAVTEPFWRFELEEGDDIFIPA